MVAHVIDQYTDLPVGEQFRWLTVYSPQVSVCVRARARVRVWVDAESLAASWGSGRFSGSTVRGIGEASPTPTSSSLG